MDLLRYIGKRLIENFFTLIIIIIITYVLMFLAPGKFFDIQRFQLSAGSTSSLTQAQVEVLRKNFEKQYGLDQPLYMQIANYLKNAFIFKFGPSFRNPSVNIEDLIAQKFPVTLILGLSAIALAIIVGIPLGIVAALRRNSALDYSATFAAMMGQVIPSYVLGILFVLVFAATLRWLPTSGWGSIKEAILPIVTLSLGPMSAIARFTRVSVLDTLNQDYIRTAYAKGGTEQAVISRHALKNSLIPIATIIGPNLAFILAGSAVFIENIFRVPGVGQLFIEAAGWRDYPLLVTSTFVLALTVMMMNLIVDILYSVIDPRIKLK